MHHNTRTTSLWRGATNLPTFTPLLQNESADVVVVGAGTAGLTTAYLLLKAGRSVTVLEMDSIGAGETGNTTAHLASAIDDRFTTLERRLGVEATRLAAEAQRFAVNSLEAVVQQEAIDCDFERLDGYLFLAPGYTPKDLEEEERAARRAGETVELWPEAPVPTFFKGPCLRFAQQAQFQPLHYLAGLTAAVVRLGGKIYTGTRVTSVKDGASVTLTTQVGPTVQAQAVLVATNSPINDVLTMHTKQAPYRTYAVALPVAKGAVPKALYWDMQERYHYVRLAALPVGDSTAAEPLEEEMLIVGGQDHKTGQPEGESEAESFERLEAWVQERFPFAGAVSYRWSGQVMEPADGLAFLGRNPGEKNVYIITGDSGMGITNATLGAHIVTDLILGKANPYAELHSPSRLMTHALGTFTKENLNVAAQLLNWLTPGEVPTVEAIQPGQGALLREGLGKLAVYKDESGDVHACSAVCTHLGCAVNWNTVEQSWDCPCHGSRFDPYGKVLSGPAKQDLKAVSIR